MVDNSQGHSAYAADALLVSRMNMRPGGKQARLRDGWYRKDGRQVIQPMIFPSDHPEFANEPKGIKQVLVERGLYVDRLRMQCSEKCSPNATQCCTKRVLENQPDFKA